VHHYHTHYEHALANGEGTMFGTGSTESENRYANVMLAASAIPSQRLNFVDPDKGRVTAYKVLLDDCCGSPAEDSNATTNTKATSFTPPTSKATNAHPQALSRINPTPLIQANQPSATSARSAPMTAAAERAPNATTTPTTKAHATAGTTMPDTFLGYAITCPTCGNPDAYSIPRVVELQGVGEGGLVSYTHRIDCPTCDA
jgi:hypothetical protein